MVPNPSTVRHTETRRREGRERTLACARFFVSLASRACVSRARATLSPSHCPCRVGHRRVASPGFTHPLWFQLSQYASSLGPLKKQRCPASTALGYRRGATTATTTPCRITPQHNVYDAG